MCEPTTIVAVGALVVGAVSAYGQQQQGKNAQNVANANADAQ